MSPVRIRSPAPQSHGPHDYPICGPFFCIQGESTGSECIYGLEVAAKLILVKSFEFIIADDIDSCLKASASWSARQFSSLKVLRDRLGDRFLAGIVLSTAQAAYPFSDRLIGLPVSALWEL